MIENLTHGRDANVYKRRGRILVTHTHIRDAINRVSRINTVSSIYRDS